ncbi:efflux RND transporter periplasmic adaptor subunit [Celeribacter persicus]|jgi:RND family efflux transporter, MFP subunit|uniref:RND family efflux transporter MFP subunit n=1 Tax=Celeribacter persicus TaxID=1651082 RepID=A0A2T5HPM5_9RHOB|nr:efflux RND transporter periplasmic adaptor subunit [Celeribacter persicus]PTQ73522.1 RND family efflux transporter MFP subunit [Celeribacter persicus]
MTADRNMLVAFLLAVLPLAGQAEPPLNVELITAQSAPVVQELRVIGSVEATDSFPASFRRGGQIDQLNAEVGQRFSAGEVIARIDPTNIIAQLDAAQANLDAAEAALVQAAQARDRTRSMLDRGVGTQAQYDEAQQDYLEAKAQRDQASALLETAEQAFEDTELKADRDVTVIERYADLGEVVSAGTAVVQLAPEGQRQAVFLAPDTAGLSTIRGHVLELDPAGPVAAFEATVTEVLPVLNDTGTVEIHADIPTERAVDIPIGTSITGRIALRMTPRILLPWTALSANAEGPAVWVRDPVSGTVTPKQVRIDRYEDDMFSIAEGLEEGDVVVGAGSHLLYAGRRVEGLEDMQ